MFYKSCLVPLAEQQKGVIEKNTTLKVSYFTGDMGVDFWDKQHWQNQFNNNNVLVMTAQILLNILQHGFIRIEDINLLILDECHNATKKHPYVRIMELYLAAEKKGKQTPLLMGLTASIINEKLQKSNISVPFIRITLNEKMKKLESTLRSKCITCSDPEATAQYAPKPEEMVVECRGGYDNNGYTNIDKLIRSTILELDNMLAECSKL